MSDISCNNERIQYGVYDTINLKDSHKPVWQVFFLSIQT